MIVKPTVNELLKHIENRYALVIATSKRAREIANGDQPLVNVEDKSPVTIAANEIKEGKVYIESIENAQKDIENIEDVQKDIENIEDAQKDIENIEELENL